MIQEVSVTPAGGVTVTDVTISVDLHLYAVTVGIGTGIDLADSVSTYVCAVTY